MGTSRRSCVRCFQPWTCFGCWRGLERFRPELASLALVLVQMRKCVLLGPEPRGLPFLITNKAGAAASELFRWGLSRRGRMEPGLTLGRLGTGISGISELLGLLGFAAGMDALVQRRCSQRCDAMQR